MVIEKIVMSQTDGRPKTSVHSAFYQTYIQSSNVLETAGKIFGLEHLPTTSKGIEDWRLLFCYGAGYQGGGVYISFGGFLVHSPAHGFNFAMTDCLETYDDKTVEFQYSRIGVRISGADSVDLEGIDKRFELCDSEFDQVQQVISSWHSLFELSEVQDGGDGILLLSQDKNLPTTFKRINKRCFVEGGPSMWEQNIGIFSEHWGFSATFR